MTQHRKARGMRTQLLVAEHLKANGWPHAQSAGAGRPGADVLETPDIAVEVKARTNLDPLAWVKQAEKSADGRFPFAVFRCNGQGEDATKYVAMVRFGDLVQLLQAAGYGDQGPVSAETPADTVTEQAAKVIANHSEHGACMTAECSEDLLPVPYPRNRDDRNAFWDRHIARALHAAGLLADPADRDELEAWRSGRRRKAWPTIESVPDGLHYAAELARAQGTEGGEAHDELLRQAASRLKNLNDHARMLLAEKERAEAELDELRATVDQVAIPRDRWARLAGEAMDADTREWLDAVSKSLRAALDGGES